MVSQGSSPHHSVLFRPNISFNKAWRPIQWKKNFLVHDSPPHPVCNNEYSPNSKALMFSMSTASNTAKSTIQWQSSGKCKIQLVMPLVQRYHFQVLYVWVEQSHVQPRLWLLCHGQSLGCKGRAPCSASMKTYIVKYSARLKIPYSLFMEQPENAVN